MTEQMTRYTELFREILIELWGEEWSRGADELAEKLAAALIVRDPANLNPEQVLHELGGAISASTSAVVMPGIGSARNTARSVRVYGLLPKGKTTRVMISNRENPESTEHIDLDAVALRRLIDQLTWFAENH